ncbi:MAG: response regulator [Clostridiaceae bacterium]|nr:response regulator [Clostridiaceae bacterium]
MWKLLIADDEPKIRQGLRNGLDWNALDIEVIGEAEDGEVALEIAKASHPDIALVDICMPFLDGLQFIEKLNEICENCIVIVITGHDKFSYAQKAVRLKVFDFLLKPVTKEQLRSVLIKAKEELDKVYSKNKYFNWAKQQLEKNRGLLKQQFLNEWINGSLSYVQIEEQLRFFDMNLDGEYGMIMIKVAERIAVDEIGEEWDKDLLIYAIKNIVEELLAEWQPNIIFEDSKSNIVAILPIEELKEWVHLGVKLESTVEHYLKQTVLVSQAKMQNGIKSIPSVYHSLLQDIKNKSNSTPIVMLARKYIDTHYFKENLSLIEVAKEMQISATYLSRLLKQEIGLSFIDYLTQVRIKKAMELMNDPSIKLYEVAQRVGYSSQHYFSTAFKRILGMPPGEYRKGKKAIAK